VDEIAVSLLPSLMYYVLKNQEVLLADTVYTLIDNSEKRHECTEEIRIT
jgi:hypothetical protein